MKRSLSWPSVEWAEGHPTHTGWEGNYHNHFANEATASVSSNLIASHKFGMERETGTNVHLHVWFPLYKVQNQQKGFVMFIVRTTATLRKEGLCPGMSVRGLLGCREHPPSWCGGWSQRKVYFVFIRHAVCPGICVCTLTLLCKKKKKKQIVGFTRRE